MGDRLSALQVVRLTTGSSPSHWPTGCPPYRPDLPFGYSLDAIKEMTTNEIKKAIVKLNVAIPNCQKGIRGFQSQLRSRLVYAQAKNGMQTPKSQPVSASAKNSAVQQPKTQPVQQPVHQPKTQQYNQWQDQQWLDENNYYWESGHVRMRQPLPVPPPPPSSGTPKPPAKPPPQPPGPAKPPPRSPKQPAKPPPDDLPWQGPG